MVNTASLSVICLLDGEHVVPLDGVNIQLDGGYPALPECH
jgi:hypothetical protein